MISMEPLGKKLKEARLAKSISLEEASRVTKIRPSRIEEIEAEDFSSFPSLAYAKGFLLIYGKFLDVDVTPYLEAFETSDRVTVDGYSYLQGNGTAVPPAPIVRRQSAKRPALFPLFIAVGVLVVGLYLMKLFLDIQRITPAGGASSRTATTASASPSPATPAPENIVAPRAIPVEGTPPADTAAMPSPPAAATEPEVRRAEPIQPAEESPPPQESASPALAVAPEPSVAAESPVPTATPTPTPVVLAVETPKPSLAPSPPSATPKPTPAPIGRVQIIPVRKTFVRVIVDNNTARPAFEGWLSPSDPPLSFRGQRVRVKALERGAIQITKNGAPVRGSDSSVDVE